MTQTLWFSAADSFWNMSAEKSAEAASMKTRTTLFIICVSLIVTHRSSWPASALQTAARHRKCTRLWPAPYTERERGQERMNQKTQLVSAGENHLRESLPWRVKWCLGAGGGFPDGRNHIVISYFFANWIDWFKMNETTIQYACCVVISEFKWLVWWQRRRP